MIRTATLNDLDKIMIVENSAFKMGIAESKVVFRSRIETFPDGFMVVEMDGKIVAYLCSEMWEAKKTWGEYDFSLNTAIETKHRDDGSIFYISSMAVLPKFRGRGYATMLFKEALQIAMGKNCKKAILIVCKEWKNAIKIYVKHGFEPIFIKEGFFEPNSERNSDGIVMVNEFLSPDH